eukprot:SAG31_NODE_18877_length_619_cov_1.286538_1_plen_103_part_00
MTRLLQLAAAVCGGLSAAAAPQQQQQQQPPPQQCETGESCAEQALALLLPWQLGFEHGPGNETTGAAFRAATVPRATGVNISCYLVLSHTISCYLMLSHAIS